ncbi:DUF488 domain-containing protein [Microlunatus sp. Y2014]|uniref:DUF488 domain-containing protein n=1 Tax=Microlunatus sp. Y2014 TaxID=3418488 RepID=UPI003DA6E03E
MTQFRVKRIHDDPADSDGHRLLVDRLWPRGVSKEQAQLDGWAKEVTPSTELRQAFHDGDLDEAAFAERYRDELDSSGAVADLINDLPSVVTLLTAVKDPEHGHVPVLLQALRDAN